MKLKWPAFNAAGTVLIPLAAESFCLAKHEVNLYGELFTPKQELHVTLIGSKTGDSIQCKIKQAPLIKQQLADTFEAIDWSYRQTGPVHLLVREKKGVVQKSIILLLSMPGVAEFYKQLKSQGIIAADTAIPPPHVTLYTQNCPLGIGVADKNALKLLSRQTLSLKMLNKLCR